MRTTRRARALVAGVAAAGMLLTACGDDTPEESDVTGDAPAETTDEPDATTDDDAATDGAEAAAGDDACTQAVDDAADVGDLDAAVEFVDGAIAACQDLDSMRRAAEAHTDTLDTSELEAFVLMRCVEADNDIIVGSPVCDEVMAG